MVKLERVDYDSIDWRKLDSFHDRTIYQTKEWLDFVAETQSAEPVVATLLDGGETLGYFTGLIVRKWGLRILGSPFKGWTTSYMGFNLSPSVPRRIAVEALSDLAFNDLKCQHLELLDRRMTRQDVCGLGFYHEMYSGFEIDLRKSEDELFKNMSSACRRCIRKAKRCSVIIEEAHDSEFADEYYAQARDVFAKQSLVPTYGIERVRKLIKHLLPTGRLLLLRVRDPNGFCIATGIFPAMNQRMFFWGNASWRKHQILRPNELLHWYAMRYWKRRGIQFYDMGGSGEYKKKYGGYRIEVLRFMKSKHSALHNLRNIAKHLVKGRQRLLGIRPGISSIWRLGPPHTSPRMC